MKEKVLVIAASNNKSGNSAVAAKWFVEALDIDHYELEWVYLYDLNIPYFTNENRKALIQQDSMNKDIRELIDKIESVDNVVITTPVWNFSLPAALKNMIDRTLCSGRVWSAEKQKKVPGWKGKRFYLIFTCGGPWYSLIFNRYAIGQLYWVLRYYGAKSKIIKIIFNCGNGKECVIDHRESLRKRLITKGKKIFKY